jgi:predicted MFS family arabinose efflux permease
MTSRETSEPSAVGLAVAGAATVATAFGMARYGYGLLLPDIQDDLMLGATVLGAIGTLGYCTYMLATALVTRCVARAGARATVVAGGLFAVAGTIVVALATGPVVLGTGVGIAGASAGLVYPPFADAVEGLPDAIRARTLATITCGTGWGVAFAAPIAVLAADSWRWAYSGFAVCAALSTVMAARTLPPSVGRIAPDPQGAARLFRRAAAPLLAAAVFIGLGSAVYWTFAVDHVRDAGLDQTAGRVLLGVAGITSVLAIAAADVSQRLGARRTFVGTALLLAAAIAATSTAAGSLPAVLVAAAVFGATYNTAIAVAVLWSAQVYADRPSAGVAAIAGGTGIGLLCGPLAGGLVADIVGLTPALLGGAALILAAALLASRHTSTTRPHREPAMHTASQRRAQRPTRGRSA